MLVHTSFIHFRAQKIIIRQSQAVIIEGAALLRRMAKAAGFTTERPGEHYTPRTVSLGVAGLSWGGAMASCVALVSRLPVACMVGLGSDSPRVMATGAINWQLDWPTLMAEKVRRGETACAYVYVQDRPYLYAYLTLRARARACVCVSSLYCVCAEAQE